MERTLIKTNAEGQAYLKSLPHGKWTTQIERMGNHTEWETFKLDGRPVLEIERRGSFAKVYKLA